MRLWQIYEYTFVPQYLDLEVQGGKLEVAEEGDFVHYWVLPFEKELLVRLKPDVSTASRFYRCPLDACDKETAVYRSFQMHHSRVDPIDMILTEAEFGGRSSFELRGFFFRRIYVGVIGFERVWIKLGRLPQTLEMQPVAKVKRDILVPDLKNPAELGLEEVEFGFQANWSLMQLVHEEALLTVHALDANLQPIGSQDLPCKLKRCSYEGCVLMCQGLSFSDHCPGSCDLVLRGIQIRAKSEGGLFRLPATNFTAEIRDADGFFLGPLLELQKEVEVLRLTEGLAGPVLGGSRMHRALAARNNLLAEASLLSKSNLNRSERARPASLLLTGLTGVGKSSACFFLTSNKSCEYANSLESHTMEVAEVTGHAFNDELQPMLRVWDIPGFGDTKGEKYNQEQWKRTLSHLAQYETNGLDCILWIVNGAIRRNLSVRKDMLRQYRASFGVSFYNYLKMIINFVPMTDQDSHRKLLEKWILALREFIIEEEKEWLKDESRFVLRVRSCSPWSTTFLNYSQMNNPQNRHSFSASCFSTSLCRVVCERGRIREWMITICNINLTHKHSKTLSKHTSRVVLDPLKATMERLPRNKIQHGSTIQKVAMMSEDWPQMEERVVSAVRDKLSIVVVDLNPLYLTGPERVALSHTICLPFLLGLPVCNQPLKLLLVPRSPCPSPRPWCSASHPIASLWTCRSYWSWCKTSAIRRTLL